MLLMLDNYDSFTYNVVHYLMEIGCEVLVRRTDQISVDTIDAMQPEAIVISPGPCTPNEAGISLECIKKLGPHIPILGICLGHQAMIQAFGGTIIRAKTVMHGKTSQVHHTKTGLFDHLISPFSVTRYHSLVADYQSLPDCFEITAWTEKEGTLDEIMAVHHKQYPMAGVQFHPESVMTEHGHDLLRNFIHHYIKETVCQ